MSSRIGKWGGSLSVRLPSNVVAICGLKAGDYVQVRLRDSGHIQILPLGKTVTVLAEPNDTGKDVHPVQERPVQW